MGGSLRLLQIWQRYGFNPKMQLIMGEIFAALTKLYALDVNVSAILSST